MELTLILIIGIVSVVATSAVSERIGVAAPLSLVVLGIALSFLPGVHVRLDPELVLSCAEEPDAGPHRTFHAGGDRGRDTGRSADAGDDRT